MTTRNICADVIEDEKILRRQAKKMTKQKIGQDIIKRSTHIFMHEKGLVDIVSCDLCH